MKLMKKFSLLTVATIMLTFGLAGCKTESIKTNESNNGKEKAENVSKKITFEDTKGKELTLKVNPKKVVVFDMGILDTIQALGKGENVVGVPTANLPKYLDEFSKVDSVGGIKEPDLEKINQLQPDLIIISGRQEDSEKELEKIAPTAYLSVDNTDVWTSTKKNIETVGKIFDESKKADKKIQNLEKDIQAVKIKAQKTDKKTLVTLVNEGQLSAYGKGSRFGIIHDIFGFPQADEDIKASTHGQSVSYEYVLEKNPEILFVVDRTQAIGGDDSQNKVSENELVKQTKAAKADKVISLTPDVWYLSGGGIESTKLMIKDVEKALD